jgi:thiol-disulfide isomerase/thioredoxin
VACVVCVTSVAAASRCVASTTGAPSRPSLTRTHRYVVPPDAPDWFATTLGGLPVTMRSLRGQVVVLDFWGTWCPPCIAWLPHMVALEKQYGPRGVEFITVNIEPGRTPERHLEIVRDFMARNKYAFPVIVDSDSTVMHAHGIQIFPTVMVVDANGRIRYASSGASNEVEASLVSQLDDLLKPADGNAPADSKNGGGKGTARAGH